MISSRLLMSEAITPVAVGSAGGNDATMWRPGTQTSYSNCRDMLAACSVLAPCHPGVALRDLVLVQRGQALIANYPIGYARYIRSTTHQRTRAGRTPGP